MDRQAAGTEKGVTIETQPVQPPQPPPPSPPPRLQTQEATNFMFIGLICYVLSNLFGMASSLILATVFEDYRLVFERLPTLMIGGGLGTFSTLLIMGFIVLAFISFYKFYKGKEEFGPTHIENVTWARNFLIIYIILFALATSIGYISFIFESAAVGAGVGSALAILMGFFFAFFVMYLVRGIAGPLERDLIYVFAGLTILVALIGAVGVRMIWLSSNIESQISASYNFTAALSLFDAIAGLLAMLAYRFIKNDLKAHGTSLPKARRAKLPRPKSVSRVANKIFTNPVSAMIAIFVVAIICGAAVGLSVAPPVEIDIDINPIDEIFMNQPLRDSMVFTGNAQEGETVTVMATMEMLVYNITVVLAWEDEPDAVLRTNQPDSFTIELKSKLWADSGSGTNPHGETGGVALEFRAPSPPVFMDTIEMYITLESAGDQEGPVGIGGSPLTIEDNSNDFEIVILYEYIE